MPDLHDFLRSDIMSLILFYGGMVYAAILGLVMFYHAILLIMKR